MTDNTQGLDDLCPICNGSLWQMNADYEEVYCWHDIHDRDIKQALLNWHNKQIEEIARTAFKKSVYLNVDGDAKYWSDSGDYNSQAMDRFFPQEWFDQKFMPAIEAERNKLNPSKSTPFNKLKEQANDETL